MTGFAQQLNDSLGLSSWSN